MGLWYSKDTSMSMTAYADADHAGCQDTKRSTSGSAQFLGDKLVSWSSKKQKCTAISSTEAEYIALSSAIALCCNNVPHSRAKHIDVRCHFIKDQVENGIAELYFIRTEYQLADIFTKLLPRERFNFLIEKLSMRSMSSEMLKPQQKALDDALVALADRLEFEKCNMRLKTDMKLKEVTFQVVQDALALNLFYCAFLITADVPAIYIDLGHTEDITYLTDVNVDYLHQPWRAFATVINKCLSGKETGMDKIRLSHIENKDANKTNKMSYPRFTKIIIDYFMSKDQSISRRNKMFWHTARDDTMFTSMRCISKHEDIQTYYAFASGEKAPKPKYIQKKADLDTSPKKKPVQATKAEQIKLATKRSKKDFHVSHASGSGDGVNTQSKVLDEQQQKTSGTYEGTSTIPGVPDVPTYESESDKKDEIPDPNLTKVDQTKHEEEDVDDKVCTPSVYELTDDEETMDDEEDDEVIKELYGDVNVNLGNKDTKMTYADQEALEQQNVSQESGFEQEEEDAHVTLTPVLDVQKADEPVQSSSVSFDFTSKLLNLENPSPADNEIASLMETSARYATAIPEIIFPALLQLFLYHLLIPNFASLFKFEQRVSALESQMSKFRQTSQFAEAISSIPGIVDTYLASKMKEVVDVVDQLQTNKLREEAQAENQEFLNQVDSTMKAIIKDQVKAQVSKIMPNIEKYVTEYLAVEVLVRSTNQPQTSYAVAASMSEFELKKILIDRSDIQKNLYNALVKSYNNDNDIITSYGDVVILKRG
ncbi:hypothetical protein Tco_0998312 [Tanacetum coccineum]